MLLETIRLKLLGRVKNPKLSAGYLTKPIAEYDKDIEGILELQASLKSKLDADARYWGS